MNIEHARLLSDYAGGELREDYSGRGMQGKETAGIVVESLEEFLTAVVRNIDDIARDAENEEIDFSSFRCRVDSMGRQTIIY